MLSFRATPYHTLAEPSLGVCGWCVWLVCVCVYDGIWCYVTLQGWLPMVAAKQAYFHAVAQHHMGLVAQAKKNFGEAVARLQVHTVYTYIYT